MRTKSLAGVLIALLLMAVATAVSAQEVTQAEKDKALQYLETTRKNVLEATKGLSEAQWNFKPGPDRWSVAQVMEHIAAAEDFIRGMVKEKIMMAPAGEPGRDVKKTDEGVLAMVPDRTNKVQAPEPLVPTNRFGSPEASIKHFVEPGDHGRLSENRHGPARSRRGQPDGKTGWVRVCSAHCGTQRTPHQADQ